MTELRHRSTGRFHPVLEDWFAHTFGVPTPVQTEAWEAILDGRHALIAAPTGSGKTLAALLPCLDRIAKGKEASGASYGTGIRVLYVTPLKALNNDIQHHLLQFVESIESRSGLLGLPWPGIRSAVRTGDTSASRRAAMLRQPPEVLLTTPESLYLMLTSEKSRSILRTVEQVIVDEIHHVAPDKRGAHLSLSLERLTALCGREVQRIGVSATQKPLERVARFLGGWTTEGEPRDVTIVESRMDKIFELTVTMPDFSKPFRTREEAWFPIIDRLVQLMDGSRSTLIFVNGRRLCERLCLRLNEHAGYELASTHHGSLSREKRLEVERLLKEGRLKALVATSSLELGIDVGHVDLVIQVDPPFDAASGIQRIGRAGHSVGEPSRGIIIVRDRGSLPAAAVLGQAIARREIEAIRIPQQPLDVLSQHIVAMVAAEDWSVEALHLFLQGSDSYRGFPKERLLATLEVLSGKYPFARPLLDWDRGTGRLTRRSGTGAAAVIGAGTIPQSSAYPVHHADSRSHLGELDEEFVHESRIGDVFQLGTSSWMIRSIERDRIYVSEAVNRMSEIPFWRNESGGRSYELGEKIGQLLEQLEARLVHEREGSLTELDIAQWLGEEYRLDALAAGQLIQYVRSQLAASAVPTHRRIVVERYKDLLNQTHLVVHTHWGRRLNRTWLLAIERQFGKLLPYKLYGNAKDQGIELILPNWDESWMQALHHVSSSSLEELLAEGLPGSPLLSVSFRRIAETSLLLSRSFTRVPLWQKRLRSAELLRDSLPYAEQFPFLQEAVRECMTHYLDADRLNGLLDELASGRLELVMREMPHPSPLASQFISDYVNMQMYEGDGLDPSVQLQLLQSNKAWIGELFGAERLKQALAAAVAEAEHELPASEASPEAGNEPGDVIRLLKQRGDLSLEELSRWGGESVEERLVELERSGRLESRLFGNERRWICSDERVEYDAFPSAASAVALIAGRFADHRLSFTEQELASRYPELRPVQTTAVIEMLLEQELIEHAPFAVSKEERLWCSRKVAARLIRRTIEQARRQAEPAEPMRWCGHIAQMQYVLPGTQLHGEEGLLAVITRLQGLYLPVSIWESIVFPTRVAGYRKDDLDRLCASGEIVWLGRKEPGEKEGKIAWFLAGSKPLFSPFVRRSKAMESGSVNPELLQRLRTSGATFLTKLSRDTGKLPSELYDELLQLVWEGSVSNDQFTPLRVLTTSKQSGAGFAKLGSGQGRWYWTGSLLDGELQSPDSGIETSAVSWIHHLLQSYGILTKELASAHMPFDWDSLLPMCRKLEEWGAVTRGMFWRGHTTLQFTSREAADHIRRPLGAASSLTLLASVDPANPFGLVSGWPPLEAGASFARKPGNYLAMRGGDWLYWIEGNGRRIFEVSGGGAAGGSEPELVKKMLRLLLQRNGAAKVKIEWWNGVPAEQSEGAALLRPLGAERDNKSLVLWKHQL